MAEQKTSSLCSYTNQNVICEAVWLGVMGGLTLHYNNLHGECGRPIGMWMLVQCAIWAIFLAAGIIQSALACCDKPAWMLMGIRHLLQPIVWFCWWIAGMVIFFNKHNNCGLEPKTHGMHNLVLFCLIIGMVQLACIVCIGSCALCFKSALDSIPGAHMLSTENMSELIKGNAPAEKKQE